MVAPHKFRSSRHLPTRAPHRREATSHHFAPFVPNWYKCCRCDHPNLAPYQQTRFCSPFVFMVLRIAFPAKPFVSHISALPPGCTPTIHPHHPSHWIPGLPTTAVPLAVHSSLGQRSAPRPHATF